MHSEFKDLNELHKIPELKLHIKQLQESIWDYYTTIKTFKATLVRQDMENKKQIKRLQIAQCVTLGLLLVSWVY